MAQAKSHIVTDSQMWKQCKILKHKTDAAQMRRQVCDIPAHHFDAALIGYIKTRNGSQQHGFARPTRSQQRHVFIPVNGKVDAVKRNSITKCFGDVLKTKDRCHCSHLVACPRPPNHWRTSILTAGSISLLFLPPGSGCRKNCPGMKAKTMELCNLSGNWAIYGSVWPKCHRVLPFSRNYIGTRHIQHRNPSRLNHNRRRHLFNNGRPYDLRTRPDQFAIINWRLGGLA